MEDENATADEPSYFGIQGLLKQFISAYEHYPFLWDKEHSDYKDRNKREKALKKLVEIYNKIRPGASVEDVKKKINSLRSNYRKELQKIMHSQDAANGEWGEIYKPRSWVFYELTFLGNFGGSAPQPLLKSKLEDPSENVIDLGHDDSIDRGDFHESTSEDSTPLRAYSTQTKRKKPTTKPNQEPSCSYVIANDTSHSLKSDDNLHQATVWANKLNTLDPLQRIYAEKAINDILFEAELRNLTRESVTRISGITDRIIAAKQEDELISRI